MSALRFHYQTIEFDDTDIHIKTLRDRQEFFDPLDTAYNLGISSANWSLFGIVWASGEILAKQMYKYDIRDKRILEVGCGIGLASMVLNARSADITATDYHPLAESLLCENTKLNNAKTIPFVHTSWIDQKTDLGTFDMIIGSDLLYEKNHAEELSQFINQHAKKNCTVIIIDPFRKHHASFSKKMKLMGYSYKTELYENMNELTQSTQGCNRFQTLSYNR